MDQRDKARQYLEEALAINPDDTISQHMLAAITGNQVDTSTPEYAQNLFNNYALYYDQHMQGQLRYGIPQHLGRQLHALELLAVPRTLDLGCGTGLSGVVLREITEYLIGVDISAKMLAQAKEKGIYDELIQAELIHYLTNNNPPADLIIAADVLPYFGNLSDLFQLIKAQLRPHGYFIFTTEISTAEDWHLESSARFSHHPDYIQQLIQQNGFEFIAREKIPARLQNQCPLEVFMYTIRQPGSS
jgi:predicted TPR repeat methyltransferase